MSFVVGQTYTREQISSTVGGSTRSYLPTSGGEVVCGAFRREDNPDVPNVILVGLGPRIRGSAEILEQQAVPIPVFVKRRPKAWEFVGIFRLRRSSADPAEIHEHAQRANRVDDVCRLLFLDRVS
jgi:hypothetical protein